MFKNNDTPSFVYDVISGTAMKIPNEVLDGQGTLNISFVGTIGEIFATSSILSIPWGR